jgi:3-hydroxyacyl-[acyl-carrier-protein] dehydratase
MRFLLIDRLLTLVPGERASAARTFPVDDRYLADHFPGLPLVPGVLLTEAMAQVAGWALVPALTGLTVSGELMAGGRWPLLTLVEHAKFRRFVRPGEALEVTADVVGVGATTAEARATTSLVVTGVAPILVATARLAFRLFDPANDEWPGHGTTGAGPAQLHAWAAATFAELGGPRVLRCPLPFLPLPPAGR